MDEIANVWLPIVTALIRAPVAWRTPRQLAAAVGRRVDETMDLLCEMDVAGWLDVRDGRQGVVISFSAWAVARLGLKLIEVGPSETPRWAFRDAAEPRPPAAKHVSLFAQSAALANEGDPAPEPSRVAELAEEAARVSRARGLPAQPGWERDPEKPWPTVLIGLRLAPWPGPRRDQRAACPACGDRRLEPHMYCLYCDRWGLDPPGHSGDDADPGDRPGGGNPWRRARAPSRASLRNWSQHERQRLKDKRRKKVSAQIEAQRRHQPGKAPTDTEANRKENGSVAPRNGAKQAPQSTAGCGSRGRGQSQLAQGPARVVIENPVIRQPSIDG
jgi:hypothetical protein